MVQGRFDGTLEVRIGLHELPKYHFLSVFAVKFTARLNIDVLCLFFLHVSGQTLIRATIWTAKEYTTSPRSRGCPRICAVISVTFSFLFLLLLFVTLT